MIFIRVGFTHSVTILDISGICRHWRQVVLATPKAWSTISPEVAKNRVRQSLYITRSKPALLHVTLDPKTNYALTPILQETERMNCLSMGRYYSMLMYRFSELEKLILLPSTSVDDAEEWHVGSSCLSRYKFPKLKVLVANEPPFVTFDLHPISPKFPPLQCLATTLHFESSERYTTFVCRQTLVSLSVTVSAGHFSDFDEVLNLPRLRYFKIVDPRETILSVTLEVDAPHLVSVHLILTDWKSTELRLRDSSTVTHLQTHDIQDVYLYPALQSLWIEETIGSNLFSEAKLGICLDKCPHLENIRCIYNSVPDFELEGTIRDSLLARGSTISVSSADSAEVDLPGSVISTDMSCNC